MPRPGEPGDEPVRLIEAMQQSGGNLARATRLLGMSRGSLRYRLYKYGLSRSSWYLPSLLRREESGARAAEAPLVFSTLEGAGQSEGVFVHRDESPVGLRPGSFPAPTTGWEPKPVSVLAIEATWPDLSEAEAGRYEPWTVGSRWEQRMAEKVGGAGASSCRVPRRCASSALGCPRRWSNCRNAPCRRPWPFDSWPLRSRSPPGTSP